MTDLHEDVARPPIYQQDGVWYYRASAIGSCINELVLLRKGEEPEWKTEYIERVLEVGNEYEDEVRTLVAESINATVTADTESVQLEVAPGHVIVGNTDGRLEGPEAGIEVKTLGETAFANFLKSGLDRFPEYQWQLSVYMHATSLPWVYAAAPRDRWKDDDGEWQFKVDVSKTHILPLITEPPIPLSRLRRKVKRIETLAALPIEDLPACEKAKFCSMVRFHDLIGGNMEAEQGELVEPGDELYDLVLKRVELKAAEDETVKARKTVDEELKRLMEGPARIEGVGRLVPIVSQGRTIYDYRQMVLDGLDIDGYQRQGSPYSQLRWYEEKK